MGLRFGEIRALKWSDVFWADSGIMITKAVKYSGKIGSVKEKKDKFVRLPERAMYYLEFWKDESLAPGDDDFIFYGKETGSPVDRGTISTNFRKALDRVGIDRKERTIVLHSLRHTFNTYSLGVLPSEVVRKFTGHSSETMSRYYYHPLLKQELKSMDVYQDKINQIWG